MAECGLTHLHVFPYSPAPRDARRAHAAGGPRGDPRAGGAPARQPAPTPCGGTSTRRSADALTVLAERGGIGRSADFTAVRLAGAVAAGTFHDVGIAGHDGARLIGA